MVVTALLLLSEEFQGLQMTLMLSLFMETMGSFQGKEMSLRLK